MKFYRFSQIFPVVALLVILPWAAAPQGKQGSGSGTGTTPKAPSLPSLTTTSPDLRLPTPQTVPEVIFITGSVLQEDGVPPPFGTTIELDCGDTITREATVDSNGHYGFQLGSNDRIGRVSADAGDPMGLDPFGSSSMGNSTTTYNSPTSTGRTPLWMKLLRCELRAQSPGYRSSSVRFDSGQISGYTEVHNILIYPSERVQGTSVSVTSLLAPKNAKKSIERASKALRKDKFSEAEAILKSSIQSYAKNAEAWYLLGQAYQLQLRTKDARESYEKAIDLDSRYVRPYLPLARLALSERNWKASADLSNRALELDPIAFPEAYFLNALSQYHLEELVLAEKSARRGERLDFSNQYPQMHLLLANILAKRHDQGGSLEELRRYLKIAPNAKDAPLVRSQVQEKEKLVKAASK